MQKKITIAIFALLSLALVAIFSFLLNSDEEVNIGGFVAQIHHEADKTEKNKKTSWSEKLAKVKTRDYYYPVNNLFVQIDLSKQNRQNKPSQTKKRKPKEVYRLMLDKNSRYSLFCVRQTLKRFSLPFIFVKEKNENFIIINSHDIQKMQEAINALEQYDIKSKIKKVAI